MTGFRPMLLSVKDKVPNDFLYCLITIDDKKRNNEIHELVKKIVDKSFQFVIDSKNRVKQCENDARKEEGWLIN